MRCRGRPFESHESLQMGTIFVICSLEFHPRVLKVFTNVVVDALLVTSRVETSKAATFHPLKKWRLISNLYSNQYSKI